LAGNTRLRSIEVERASAVVAIHVRDRGIGIAARDSERVFREFVRLDESLTARVGMDGGRGRSDPRLGLAVFSSEGCRLCQALAPAVESVANDPRVAVATFDEVADAELWRSLAIPGSPFALALDEDGTVLAKGTFNNLAQLESVLATAERRRAEGRPRTRIQSRTTGRFPIGA
jgi:hypothetical protein